MIQMAAPGYMQAGQPMHGYQMTINPSMFGHPLVGQQALMYGYQHHGMPQEMDQSAINRQAGGHLAYQAYMPGMTMNPQAWQIPTVVPEVSKDNSRCINR